MSLTQEEAQEFVGGGDRDLSDNQKNSIAARIAKSSRARAAWLQTRPIQEQFARTAQSETGVFQPSDEEEEFEEV